MGEIRRERRCKHRLALFPLQTQRLDARGESSRLHAEKCSGADTGVSVSKIVYKAGFTNISHWHNCSHGIYVLEGILKTHADEYGPGSFVWFPEHTVQSHGATQNNDVTFLFITNKPFDIHYTHLVGEPPQKA